MKRLSLLLCLALLSSCATVPITKKADPFYLKQTNYQALPGWEADKLSEALVPLQKSCVRIFLKPAEMSFGPVPFAGTYKDWQQVCTGLLQSGDDAAAKAYFETNFTPYEIWGEQGRDGLFTGYYEPTLHGSLTKHDKYQIPLYSRPDDLITVNLGDFKDELKGETVVGRVKGQNLVPYFTRHQIESGAIDKQDKQIVWVDNAVDAFFLHIQGSGQVVMEDGSVLRVGFAAQNGHAYFAIGQALIKNGALTKENVSMQAIRDWLEAHPADSPKIMDLNESYVFFRKLEGDGPLGAEGVALTPHRSIAIDRKKFPYGAPVFLDAEGPGGKGHISQLMVAQDTGGAIKGAVRADFFWGAGPDAAANAGVMKSAGHDYILLPKSVTVPKEYMLAARQIPKKAVGYNN